VTDNGQPTPKTDNKVVIINVPRDKFKPTLTNLPAVMNISETININDLVYTVVGDDQDKRVGLKIHLILYIIIPSEFRK